MGYTPVGFSPPVSIEIPLHLTVLEVEWYVTDPDSVSDPSGMYPALS